MNEVPLRTVDDPPLPPGSHPRDVVAAACAFAEISATVLLGRGVRRRNPAVVIIRAACAWILRERFKMSLPEIGRYLNYKDHTSIHHHLRTTCTKAATIDVALRIEAEIWRTAKVRAALAALG